jgi:hypothetical protein
MNGNQPEKLHGLLASSEVEANEIARVPILDTGMNALAVEVPPHRLECNWRVVRKFAPDCGYWPVAIWCHGPNGDNLASTLQSEDIFNRFEYKEAIGATDVSPLHLIEKSRSVDLEKFFEWVRSERDHYFKLEEVLEFEYDVMNQFFRRAPPRDELPLDQFKDERSVNRWLMNWERKNGGFGDPEPWRPDWFVPENSVLVFLPVESSWDSLAYMSYFGAYFGAEYYIALGRSWEEKFGAELVANWGTMLQCLVANPPSDLDVAWELAVEHELAAQCTFALSSLPLRYYAHGLIERDRWFLHERP